MASSVNRGYLTVFVVSALILALIFVFTSKQNSSSSYLPNVINDPVLNMTETSLTGPTCYWTFLSYTPSAWETKWLSNIDTWQYQVCAILAESLQINTTIAVLRRIMQLQQSTFHLDSLHMDIDENLSQMRYRLTCQNQINEVTERIEPLIGLIRDPLTMCPQVSSVPADLYLTGENALQSKRFLLLAPSSPFRINQPLLSDVRPLGPWLTSLNSQKLLIDIGSSFFNSRNGNTAEIGTRWFYEYFRNRSIRFDRIIAFEYQQLAPREVWEQLPDDVFPFYTFINVGVEAATENKFNPWKMLRAMAKPSDYVIVKLDIDKPPLESALMQELLADGDQTRSLIDEMFFEKHVSLDRNSREDKLKDSYELFTKMRQFGVRMHGWP